MKKLFLVRLTQTTIQQEFVYAETAELAMEIAESAGWNGKEEVIDGDVTVEETPRDALLKIHPSKYVAVEDDGEVSFVRIKDLDTKKGRVL